MGGLIDVVKFADRHISGIGGPIDMRWKGCELDMMLDPLCNLELWPWLDFEFLDSHISGMDGPIGSGDYTNLLYGNNMNN